MTRKRRHQVSVAAVRRAGTGADLRIIQVSEVGLLELATLLSPNLEELKSVIILI